MCHVFLKWSKAATQSFLALWLAPCHPYTYIYANPMVNCRISPDRKYCALDLWNRGWDTLEICDALCVSSTSLYHWEAIFREHGNVIQPPSPLIGRTRIIAQVTLTAIHTLYKQESDLYLDKLVTFLAIEQGIIVSTSTLS